MLPSVRELPVEAWRRVLLVTAGIVLGSTLVSVAVTFAILAAHGSPRLDGPALIASASLPILIGTPMSLMHLIRVAQLRIANGKLHVLATTDWLTGCLNRRAFTHAVSDALHAPGALLIVDADRFKTVNDRFGHDRGDEVLRLLAATIRTSIGEDDLFGRLGGEEFGVLLRDADLSTANVVAERIRDAVTEIAFSAEDAPWMLSVSIGGVAFARGVDFGALFRAADQRLLGVKQRGRNQCDVRPAGAPRAVTRDAAAA